MANQKKSFEFRMSKKVAELTQVVHMLFTRNHEKEVELEAFKDAYEEEIGAVVKDARGRLDRLEYQLREAERSQRGETEKQAAALDAEHKRREEELKSRLSGAEKSLLEERHECQNVRDLLIQAQNDIEKLRGGESDELARVTRDLLAKTAESERLSQQLRALEAAARDRDSVHGANKEMKERLKRAQQEMGEMKENLEGVERYKDELAAKNRQLEADVKQLKREVAKRERHSAKQREPRQEYREMSNANFMDYNEEVERLRRQVQQYRMELSNRELNFNRMFTEKQPVQIVPGASAKRPAGPQVSMGSMGAMRTAESMSQPRGMSLPRERTWADRGFEQNGYTATTEEVLPMGFPPMSPRSSLSSGLDAGQQPSNRLPQLSMDPKQRLQRLIKPKPLPREVLSGKAQGH